MPLLRLAWIAYRKRKRRRNDGHWIEEETGTPALLYTVERGGNALEDDLKSLPTCDEYAATVREMKQAHSEFMNLRKQAAAFGFTVEPDEMLVS